MSRFATKPKKHPYLENAAFLDKILYREVVAPEEANNSCIQTFPKILAVSPQNPKKTPISKTPHF